MVPFLLCTLKDICGEQTSKQVTEETERTGMVAISHPHGSLKLGYIKVLIQYTGDRNLASEQDTDQVKNIVRKHKKVL